MTERLSFFKPDRVSSWCNQESPWWKQQPMVPSIRKGNKRRYHYWGANLEGLHFQAFPIFSPEIGSHRAILLERLPANPQNQRALGFFPTSHPLRPCWGKPAPPSTTSQGDGRFPCVPFTCRAIFRLCFLSTRKLLKLEDIWSGSSSSPEEISAVAIFESLAAGCLGLWPAVM